MKKILLMALIALLTLLAGCKQKIIEENKRETNSSEQNKQTVAVVSTVEIEYKDPFSTVSIQNLNELATMRQMLLVEDESVLENYFASITGGGVQTKKDLEAFVELIDALPIVELLEGEIVWIYEEKNHEIGYDIAIVSIQAEDGRWARLEYEVSEKDPQKKIQKIKESQKASEGVGFIQAQNIDGKIKVYAEKKEAHSTGVGQTYTWTMVVDGILTKAVYYTPSPDAISVSGLLSDKQITRLADIETKHRG